MCLPSCALLLLAWQPPADDPFVRLGVAADLVATVSSWRPPAPRIGGAGSPALARKLVDAPARAAHDAEAFVRSALAEIRPLPLLRAGALGQGSGRADRKGDKQAQPRLDARAFEDLLERSHREIVRALGSGRELALVAPELQASLHRVLQPGGCESMSEADRGALRDVIERAGKVDMAALHDEAVAIVRAALVFAEGAASGAAPNPATAGSRGVTGTVVFDRATSFGRFVIGGPGRNEYECDQIAVIVDLGGDDVYRGAVAGAGVTRRLSLVVDLQGDDQYLARNDALGAATFGIGMLLDLLGDDRYEGDSRCAGFGAAGIGALFDLAGNDELSLGRAGGGAGFCGFGLYLDAGRGKDRARVGSYTLGCGLPGGFGMFIDDGGDDERDVREGDAAAMGACGVGLGVRGWLPGGAGVFVDVDGVDHYTGGNLLCGAGLDGGVGVFFDAAGADVYVVAEWALGSARDDGVGVFIDAAGDDGYRCIGASLGGAAGCALGVAEERAGQDVYEIEGGQPGSAGAGAVGAFFEFGGKDRYRWTERHSAWPKSVPAKVSALSIREDRGSDRDVYDIGEGGVEGNDVEHRQRVPSTGGEVLRVFVDR